MADAFPDRVRIYIRGYASLLGDQKLKNVIRHRDNVIFEGEYCAPEELRAIYSKVHFNWCVDLCGGENSRWLLPNRLYEGGYFGIPALAIGSHETGRVVRNRQLGIVLETPIAEHLGDILLNMTPSDYARLRQGIESLPAANFVDNGDLAQLMRTMSQDKLNNGVSHPTSEIHQNGVRRDR